MTFVFNNNLPSIAGWAGRRVTEDQVLLAVHEAGHAVAAEALGLPVVRAVAGEVEGEVVYARVPCPDDRQAAWDWAVENLAIQYAASLAVAKLGTGYRRARLGLSEQDEANIVNSVDEAVDAADNGGDQFRYACDDAVQLAVRIVNDRIREIDRVALELLRRGRLDGAAVRKLAPFAARSGEERARAFRQRFPQPAAPAAARPAPQAAFRGHSPAHRFSPPYETRTHTGPSEFSSVMPITSVR